MRKIKYLLKYIYRRGYEIKKRNYIKRWSGFVRNYKSFVGHHKAIYIVSTPEYGNLGDHAIAMSEIDFAKREFGDFEVVEISDSEFDNNIECLHFFATEQDMIFLIGGGNFGMLYPEVEYIRRSVISKCARSNIIMFPQSFSYQNNLFDQLELKKSVQIYSKHKRLNLLMRDRTSYEKAKKHFKKNAVYYVPDIVLTWEKPPFSKNQEGDLHKIVFCIRNDMESSIHPSIIKKTKELVEEKGFIVESFDTETKRKIKVAERQNELSVALQKFSDASYVVTDRLHGMILCCLVGTPCLAFDNCTGKISGVYKWINRPEIMMYDPNIELSKQIDSLLKNYSKFQYNPSDCYRVMKDTIKQIVIRKSDE